MPTGKQHWKIISRSEFDHEQEALDFVYKDFPSQDNYRAWTNFEFVTGGPYPTRNEVDLLVACPQGVFLIEIKSHQGKLTGDTRDWTFNRDGRRKTIENPLFLTDKKCKRLKGLLEHDPAFRQKKGSRGLRVPFIEPLVFLSDADLDNQLSGLAANSVCRRDTDTRDGIMAAIKRRVCQGLPERPHPVVNTPQIKAVAKALDNLGIRPSQTKRQVNDFLLGELIDEHPEGLYQDYLARHISVESTTRVARCYAINRKASEEERNIVEEAALREARIAGDLEHQGILRADPLTRNEEGPVIFFKRPPSAQRLDHFLAENQERLSIDDRLDLLRQLAETMLYVHRKHLVHRSLSPRSILIQPASKDHPTPRALIFNWQTGSSLADSSRSPLVTQFHGSIHASQLLEDSSQVYLAPEVLSGNAPPSPEQDVFSLGALAYLLFSGKPPAESAVQLSQKLNKSLSGLNVVEAMDAPASSMIDLIKESTHGSASDRSTIADFLACLSLIEEELTQPDLEVVENPLQAKSGDFLSHGLQIVKRLGSGSVSVVFQVKTPNSADDADPVVLKVAREPSHNNRIRAEFEILQDIARKVQSRNIVCAHELIEFDELAAFTMDLAGEETVACELQEKGPVDMRLLERFGEELIRTIRDLDELGGGIAHRDIKPENMGIRKVGSQHQLRLFDFSLAQASPENIQVGTPPYLDPFIAERKVPRWDISSECYSAAVTLYQMTTGLLPQWGDGKSAPAAVAGEVTLPPEVFNSNLREAYLKFFTQALRRDYRKRFDNPGEMLRAWMDIFKDADKPRGTTTHPTDHGAPPAVKKKTAAKSATDQPEEEFTFDLPDGLTPNSQLIGLPLSARLFTALDRLELLTIVDLLRFPQFRIFRLPGVGNKTRRELGALVSELRKLFPKLEADPRKPNKASTQKPATSDTAAEEDLFLSASVDLIAEQAASLGVATGRKAERDMLQTYLGWGQEADTTSNALPTWPSQRDLAIQADVSRQRIGQALTAGRRRWAKLPAIAGLSDAIADYLASNGGICTREKLIRAVLALRPSEHAAPRSYLHASVATRASVESERSIENSRFLEYRSGEQTFLATTASLKSYALELGKIADHLAAKEQLPGAPAVIAELRAVALPSDLPSHITPLSDQALCELAVDTSEQAALSNRLEIYPIGLDARRALMLCLNALLGSKSTVAQLKERVMARVPQAAPLPDNPELKDLITELKIPLEWRTDDPDFPEGVFVRPRDSSSTQHTLTHTRSHVGSSFPTRTDYLHSNTRDLPEKDQAAFQLDKELAQAAQQGSYFVLSVPPGSEAKAASNLQDHFGSDHLQVINLEQLFLSELRQQATALKVDWPIILSADAASEDSRDAANLKTLIKRCLPVLQEKLILEGRTSLVYYPGLLARHDEMSLLAELAAEVGRPKGPHGLWIMVPASTRKDRPMLNGHAVPLPNPASHRLLSLDYLKGVHRR